MPLSRKTVEQFDNNHCPRLYSARQDTTGQCAKIAGKKVVTLVGAQAEVLDHLYQGPAFSFAVGADVAKLAVTTVATLLFGSGKSQICYGVGHESDLVRPPL